MEQLEQLLGYTFKDASLLEMALTHSSYSYKYGEEDYQRLEYLGDSILDFVVADELYKKYPHADEGVLTKMRGAIVSMEPLSQVVKEKGYYKYLRVGYGTISQKAYSDIFESICGAIYLDGGIDCARKYVLDHLGKLIDNAQKLYNIDYKSELYEKCVGRHIEFREMSKSGPEHDLTFEEGLFIDGEFVSKAKGKNTRQAQQKCAKIALDKFKKNSEN